MAASFRLMTANLLHERSDPADFARVLARHDPDVVVTQELGPDQADILASAYRNHQLRPARGFIGRGIATRLDAEFGDIDMPGRDGTSAFLDVHGIGVHMAGIHLLNPIDFPWWVSVRTRTAQLDGLFGWIEERAGPLLVVGDFNASPRWPAYKRTAGELSDLVADWAPQHDTKPERTWGWRPGWPRMLRIDHVFGRQARARHVTVDEVKGTDHNPVIVDLEVVELPTPG